MSNHNVEAWHRLMQSGDITKLDEVLADEVVFYSPIVHTPQRGKEITKAYLSAAFHVLGNESFRYVREVAEGRDAVLEFMVEVEGIVVNGVDMIRWNEQGRIVDFKVMLRPLKAINLIHQKMGEMLKLLG